MNTLSASFLTFAARRALVALLAGLILRAPVAQAQNSYHGVTVSALIYDPQGGKEIIPIIVNNTWLIEQILNVTAEERAGYALVIKLDPAFNSPPVAALAAPP